MKALITGASSGIGRDIARVLSGMGYELILCARREERLLELASTLKTKAEVIPCDLQNKEDCIALFEKTKDKGVDFLINNAGFGLFGSFDKTSLETELNMIDLNIKAVHILTKLFSAHFEALGGGRILNIASSAGLMPGGPLMATYYATKAYVVSLSLGISEELRKKGNRVRISVLCPGPVDTEFNSVAGVSFSLSGLSSERVAKYAVKKALRGKTVIIPGNTVRLGIFSQRFLSRKFVTKIAYKIQHKKGS